MTKPNFSQMSRAELRQYLIHHRNDKEAWGEFTSRPKPNNKQYPPPLDEEGTRIAQRVLREELELSNPEQTQ